MATTTNYSWTTPDDTALVKDGAAAIRSLGTAIDTTTKNLNPETTLGDIAYRSSTANTNTRLGIGTTGQVLTVSGGVPSWTTLSSGSMTLLATGTFNSTADVVFSSIAGTYKDLYLVFHSVNVWASGSGDRGFIQLNGDTGNNYNWQRSNANATSSTGISDSRFDGAYAIGDVGAAKAGSSYFRIRDYARSTAYKGVDGMSICVQDASTIIGGQFVGQYKSNTAITSITLTNASGGGIYTPASGTVYLYGVN